MALKKSEKRLLGLLGVVLVIFLLDRFVLSGDKKPKSGAASQQTEESSAVIPNINSAAPAKETVNSNQRKITFSGWRADPFAYSYAKELAKQHNRGVVTAASKNSQIAAVNKSEQQPEKQKEKKKEPVLNGVFWKEGKAFALIDDIIMEEGEEREGLKLVKIRGSEVVCRKGNRTFTIQWRESQ